MDSDKLKIKKKTCLILIIKKAVKQHLLNTSENKKPGQ